MKIKSHGHGAIIELTRKELEVFRDLLEGRDFLKIWYDKGHTDAGLEVANIEVNLYKELRDFLKDND